MTRVLGMVLTLLLGTTLGACTGDDPDEPAPAARTTRAASPEADPEREITPAWRLDRPLAGQPVVVADVALAIVTAGPIRFDIIAVEIDTGQIRWRRPMYYPQSSHVELAPPVMTDVDGTVRVVFQPPPRKPEDIRSPLLFVEPSTGKVEHRTVPITVHDPVQPCPDGVGVCLNYFNGVSRVLRRIHLREGTAGKNVATGDAVQQAGPGGLFSTRPEPDPASARLGRHVDGRTTWRRPTVGLLGVDPLGAPVFRFDPARDRYVTVLMKPAILGDVVDLRRTVSFSASTGRRLWAEDGVVACPSAPAVAPVRCRLSGTVSGAASEKVYDGLTMTIEGYEPATGETTWSLSAPASSARSALEGEDYVLPADDDSMLVTSDAGPVRVTVADGTVEEADDGIVACAHRQLVLVVMEFDDGLGRGTPAGTLHYPCHPDGKPAPSWTPAALEVGAVDAEDGRYVVATEDGLLGFTLTP